MMLTAVAGGIEEQWGVLAGSCIGIALLCHQQHAISTRSLATGDDEIRDLNNLSAGYLGLPCTR
jgi:hypothetical protein